MHEYCCLKSFLAVYFQPVIQFVLTKIKSHKKNYVGTRCGNLFSLEYISTEVIKFLFHGMGQKKSFENLFLQKGLKNSFSRTNFCNLCLTSAKARKPHPAKNFSIKVAQVLSEREHFLGKTICLFFSMQVHMNRSEEAASSVSHIELL